MNENSLLAILTAVLVLTFVIAVVAYCLLLKFNKKNNIQVNFKIKKDFLYTAYGAAMKFTPLKNT